MNKPQHENIIIWSALLHRATIKERQRQKPDSGKLAIRRDHPRRRIEMKSCMVGGLQVIVLSFEFHQNLFSGFGAVGRGVEICPSPLTWPLAYTTACTTVQVVTNHMLV